MATFELDSDFHINFHTDELVSVDEVIKSLQGLKVLIGRMPKYINTIYPEIGVESIDIYVQDIEAGSLMEALKLVFNFSPESEENARKLFNSIKADNKGTSMNHIITYLAAAFIGYTAYGLINSGTTAPQINGDNNTVIIQGDHSEINGKNLEKMLEKDANSATVKKAVIDTVTPAKGSGAYIEFPDNPEFNVPAETVKLIPREYSKPEPTKKSEFYDNVTIMLRKLDRDSSAGWEGSIPGLDVGRTKIEFDESIDTSRIFLEKMNAQVEIGYKKSSSQKTYKPEFIFIKAIL